MSFGRILVVDDDYTIRTYYEKFFRVEKLDIRMARSAEAALQTLETARIDLVILDLLLPDRSGEEVFDYICETHPETWIFVVSADISNRVARVVFSKENAMIFKKPWSIRDICNKARDIVREIERNEKLPPL